MSLFSLRHRHGKCVLSESACKPSVRRIETINFGGLKGRVNAAPRVFGGPEGGMQGYAGSTQQRRLELRLLTVIRLQRLVVNGAFPVFNDVP
jgi:hypothetical protein